MLLAVFILIIIFSHRYYDLSEIQVAYLNLLALLLILIGSFGRLWSSVYIEGRKTSVLVTDGPYSLMRNPLYMFSLIMIIGYSVALKSILIGIILLSLYIFLYAPTIFNEEKMLRDLHGKQFDEYSSKTPRFFPRLMFPISTSPFLSVSRKNIERVLIEIMGFIFFYGIIKFVESIKLAGLIETYFALY